jgi:hypothetical protein
VDGARGLEMRRARRAAEGRPSGRRPRS